MDCCPSKKVIKMFLVASCYRHQVKLRPNEPLGLNAHFRPSPLKSEFFWRLREIEKSRHMMEKMPILIFRPEIPYSESIYVV